MNPDSIEKTAPCLAVTKNAQAAFIHKLYLTQKHITRRVRCNLLTVP